MSIHCAVEERTDYLLALWAEGNDALMASPAVFVLARFV